ncbi:MAG TPA: hypothetical protein VEZ71_29220 [Archangium sp.]|nr:hypothetical protein [Archangium sp.]
MRPEEGRHFVTEERADEDAPDGPWCTDSGGEHDWDSEDGDIDDGAMCRKCPAVAREFVPVGLSGGHRA